MAGEARATSTRNMLVDLLATQYGPSTGLILVMEDAHWLDSSSWALAFQAWQTLSPLLLVIVTRPQLEGAGRPKELSSLLSVPDGDHLVLSTLTPDEIIALVNRRLNVTELPKPAEDLILEQGEGNPFYSEEIAYALRDSGFLLIEDGSARIADEMKGLQDLDFPATIQGVITSRIDRLGASEQLTVKVASVIGRIFTYRVLRNIYPEPDEAFTILDHLANLERLDITPLETPEPELAYLFKHIITQEVVYNLMTFSQRQGLHRKAAAWFEEVYSEDLSPYYPL